MSSLGKPGTSAPPLALRAGRMGWRDPRLWVGVLIVAGSVVAGARLLAAADDAVAVWAVVAPHGAGSTVDEDDVVPVRVRFTDETDIGRYLPAADPIPADVVLSRAVGEGELLPRAALGGADDAAAAQVPLDLDPNRVPPTVGPGAVVDVYVSRPGGGGQRAATGPALSGATVVSAQTLEEAFAVTGTRQVVLAVDQAEVSAFLAVLDSAADAVVRIVQRS